MDGVLVPMMFFLLMGYVLKRRWDWRERRLGDGDGGASKKELEALREERKLLQERVENLESIVCNVDFELNARLAQLATEQSRLLQAGASEVNAISAAAGEATAGRKAAEPVAAAAPVAAAVPLTAAASPRAGAKVGAASTAFDLRAHAARAAARPASPAASPTAELAPGDVLGNRYRIDRLLGRGGMGAVYLAHDEVLGELVALKLISSSWSSDPQAAIERFRREASAARRVASPNVIRIHDLGETPDGLLYISMEYFAGRTLDEILDRRGTLSHDDTGDIIGQICDGLTAAHNAGVIHRDLKPQNVLVGERNAVKIIDFGLAKATYLGGMTATGLILGTPEYMAPEQVRGRPVDARTDIYALGALTYHAVTGRPPFSGDTPIAIGFAHCSESPTPPKELRPDLSQRLSDAIVAALAKEPADRPQSAAAFRKAL